MPDRSLTFLFFRFFGSTNSSVGVQSIKILVSRDRLGFCPIFIYEYVE